MAVPSPPYAVIFVETPYNRYSLAVLTGVLEEDERLQNVHIRFVKTEERHVPKVTNLQRCVQKICDIANQHEKVVVALSFHTAYVIIIASLLQSLHRNMVTGSHESVLIVAGGSHPSGDPDGTLRLGADCIVMGEGEVTFPALLHRFFREQPFEHLQGVRIVDVDSHYRNTERPAFVDISDFPPFAMRHKRFCPMEISRGCPYGCWFCQTTFFMGGRMRHRSLESIVKYAELPRRIGMKVLRFITPSAFAYGSPDGRRVNLNALAQMLQAVSEMYGKEEVYFGSFPSEVRPEQVSTDTLELLKRYCANTNLVIGAQSGSERMLHALHRGHGVDAIVRAVELTLKAGFRPNVDFIFSLPGETTQDRHATLTLINRLIKMGARVHSHTFMPLVGTPLADCLPGVLDEEIRELMLSLRGKNLEHGRWQQQEKLARKTFEFLKHQRNIS